MAVRPLLLCIEIIKLSDCTWWWDWKASFLKISAVTKRPIYSMCPNFPSIQLNKRLHTNFQEKRCRRFENVDVTGLLLIKKRKLRNRILLFLLCHIRVRTTPTVKVLVKNEGRKISSFKHSLCCFLILLGGLNMSLEPFGSIAVASSHLKTVT